MVTVHFTAKGYKNILATHPTTFEFTKDSAITLEGDCIVGVAADFSVSELRPLLGKDVRIIIECAGEREEVHAHTNTKFNDERELVVRLGEFSSPRTFAVRADKAAKHFSAKMRTVMQQTGAKITVTIHAA